MTQHYLTSNLSIVTTPNKAIEHAREVLEADWLYTIDFEAVLSVVFECVIDCYATDPTIVVMDYVKYAMDTNSVVTPLQNDVIEATVKQLTFELKQHLEMLGILHHESRQRMQFVRVLPDTSLHLKIT